MLNEEKDMHAGNTDESGTKAEVLDRPDAHELNEDELNAVNGGKRDWAAYGCAATVEPGSDCWGTDGGCKLINIEYTNVPLDEVCKFCKKEHTVYFSNKSIGGIPSSYRYGCTYCGGEWDDCGNVTRKPDQVKVYEATHGS